MRSTAELRDELAALAEPVTPVEGYEGRIRRQAGRIRARRRLAGGAAAALCLVVLVTMVRLVVGGPAPQLAAPPPDGPFLGWPAAGEVDPGLVREATAAWDRSGSAGPYTAVRPLAVTWDRFLHAVVVLQGYDRQRAPRLAFFTSDATAADALRLRADRPAPDPVATRVISLVSPRLTGPAGQATSDYWSTYVIALAMPGVTTVRTWTTAIDSQMVQDPDAPTGRFIVQHLSLDSTAETTTIVGSAKADRLFARPRRVFSTVADGGADGDARGVPATVLGRSGEQLTVAIGGDRAVRPGQFAVVTAGLVGRVASVSRDHREATVDLVTSAGFTAPGYTNISNVTGTMRGTGGKLIMAEVAAGGEIYEGNRVMVWDPAQRDLVGAITIGRATVTRPDAADTVELTPTADLDHLSRVSIMTPFQAR